MSIEAIEFIQRVRLALLTLVGVLSCQVGSGQTLTRRLLLRDTPDSLYLNAGHKAFDRDGNYCFEIKQPGKQYYLTSTQAIGNTRFIGSTYGNGGEISYTNSSYSDPADKPWYYRNARGTKVYGAVVGKLENYETSHTRENVAVRISFRDSVASYVNGRLVSRISSREAANSYSTEASDWCAFSENGNVIYYLRQQGRYALYVNGQLLESAPFAYTQLAINDQGDYIFAKGERPPKPIGRYDYLFFIHSRDTALPYVRTVWNYELKDDGAYYYSGDDNGPSYIAINNQLHKHIVAVENITLRSRNSFLYSFSEAGVDKINVNNTIYPHPFEEIFCPTLDQAGNFAFFGLKKYYLYKFVNGQQDPKPISRYNARPVPLYISPTGESVHYFRTQDSIYLYRDNQLIFRQLAKKSNFQVILPKEFLSTLYEPRRVSNGNSLFYLEYGPAGYLVFNGVFSKPMSPINNRQSELVAGSFQDKGFFVIQKTDSSGFLINVNNRVYQQLADVDQIFGDSYFFDEKELIFYGISKSNIYQFKLTL